jgi:hypothetical protein
MVYIVDQKTKSNRWQLQTQLQLQIQERKAERAGRIRAEVMHLLNFLCWPYEAAFDGRVSRDGCSKCKRGYSEQWKLVKMKDDMIIEDSRG